jgi:hypothetical protein
VRESEMRPLTTIAHIGLAAVRLKQGSSIAAAIEQPISRTGGLSFRAQHNRAAQLNAQFGQLRSRQPVKVQRLQPGGDDGAHARGIHTQQLRVPCSA